MGEGVNWERADGVEYGGENSDLRDRALTFSRNRIRMLRRMETDWADRVNEAMKEITKDGEGYHRFSPDGRQRLLKLLVWVRRHQIGIRELLPIVVQCWSTKRNRGRIPMIQLTSERSEKILTDKLIRLYPAGENEDRYRVTRRDRYRLRSVVKSDNDNPDALLTTYREGIRRQRKIVDGLMAEFKLRRYRENPWILN